MMTHLGVAGKMAEIKELIKGNDGYVRVPKVRINSGRTN